MKKTISMILKPLKLKNHLIAIFLSLVFVSFAAAEDLKCVLDLRGKWKFDVGDSEKRSKVAFDDSKWEEIFVPAAWEDEGYPGYDGYAWYRKHFQLPAGVEKKTLCLRLGCIDDVSEVYLNGMLIGIIGGFPPDFMTAYNTEIVLSIPQNALNISEDNVIAVRVYDDGLAGGIVNGKIGLYESKNYLAPEISFVGKWQFKDGDSEKWIDPSFDDSNWRQIFVPAFWESQGYSEYDGIGWYRLHFKIPAELADKKLVLLLGRIDDLDETYINGVEIGRTGRIRSNPKRSNYNSEYRELRVYTIPVGTLKPGTDNVIAIRVYDGGGPGGIYEGPIGIMSREKYKEWKKNRPWREDFNIGPWNIFNKIFE